MRILTTVLAALLLIAPASANTPAQSPTSGQKVEIPFDPPLGEKLRYRSEMATLKGGEMTTTWSLDSYRFETADDGFRLIVEPVSHGSNEMDPAKIEFDRKIEALTRQPFVLHLNEDAEIVELERGDEYWAKIIQALRDVLSQQTPKRAAESKAAEAVVELYEKMPAKTRLAKITEPIRPLVEFAWTEMSIGQPVLGSTETLSPLGPVKQEFAVTLTKVSDGFAYVTIRSGISPAELRKLTGALLDRMNNGALKPEEITKLKAHMAAAEGFNVETVAEYKIAVEDGMLESYHSTQTATISAEGKSERRVKTLSVKRAD